MLNLSYEALAEMIESDREKIALQAATTAIASGKPYYKIREPEKMVRDVLPSVEMIARYVRSGDPSEWRSFMEQYSQRLMQLGVPPEGMTFMGDNIMEAIKALIERKLSGPENASVRERFNQRLDRLHTLGRTTVVSTHLHRNKKE